MLKFFLMIFLLVAFPILSKAEDVYLRELVEGIAKLTRGNFVFPDQCNESGLPTPIAMSDHPDCETRLKELSKAVRPTNNETAVKELIDQKKPKLVIIGETHGSPSALRFPETLYSIKKANPDTDCLFVEYPETFTSKIQELQNKGSLAFESQENVDVMVSQNQILAAGKIGLKIIPIDNHPMRSNQELSNSPEGFRNRNKVMADEIDKKLNDGTCKAAIMIVGAFHWTWGGPSANVPSLKDLIRSKTASIIPVNTGCHPTMPPPHKDPIWSWSQCKNNPDRINVEAKIETTTLSNSVQLAPSGGKWNDFDLGLVTAPTYDENCRRIL